MGRPRAALAGLGLLLVLVAASVASAQVEPGPPGPWVVDLRGVTVPLPSDSRFLPGLASGTVVPGRAFGFDVGARWFGKALGPARIAVGVDATWARGTTVESRTSPRVLETFVRVTPDVSFNFGTRNGWSYLSLGGGVARVAGRIERAGVTTALESSGAVPEVHGGAGARWFMSDHLAVGFDLRLHQLFAGSHTPPSSRFAVSAGLSLR